MCGHGRLGCSTSQVSRKKDISPGSSINTTSSSAIYTLSLHDALPIYSTSVSVWADWWGFKEEAMDGIHENAALNQQAGGRPVIHSDSPSGIQRLNQEAAKAMYSGLRSGIPITRDEALRWITVNPAWVLGLDSAVGTLEPS